MLLVLVPLGSLPVSCRLPCKCLEENPTAEAVIRQYDWVPSPENATVQERGLCENDAVHRFYTTDSRPAAVLSAYASMLNDGGWSIGNGTASLTATDGSRHLVIDARGRRVDASIDVYVWPSAPDDASCRICDGGDGESDDGLFDGVPEPEGATWDCDDDCNCGGLRRSYTAVRAPGDIVSAYASTLGPEWSIESGRGGLNATHGLHYLVASANAAGDETFFDVCIWPVWPEGAARDCPCQEVGGD
jgi:hypothetical protein